MTLRVAFLTRLKAFQSLVLNVTRTSGESCLNQGQEMIPADVESVATGKEPTQPNQRPSPRHTSARKDR